MVVNGAAIRLASVGFHALFTKGWEGATPSWPDLCMETDSTGDQETYMLDGGLPEMREWLGDRQRKSLKVYAYNLRNRDWELTVNVKANILKDDKTGLLKARFTQMGIAARLQPDALLGELLEDAFDTDGYDEVPFISNAHPQSGGNVQSNLITGALDEEGAKLEEAITALRSMEDDFGNPIDVFAIGGKPTLIVGPQLENTARAILLRERLDSGASNPNYNRVALKVFNRLRGDSWFVGILGAPLKPMIFQLREAPNVVARDQPGDEAMWNRKEIEYGVDGRWNMGYGLWQLIVGSAGA